MLSKLYTDLIKFLPGEKDMDSIIVQKLKSKEKAKKFCLLFFLNMGGLPEVLKSSIRKLNLYIKFDSMAP